MRYRPRLAVFVSPHGFGHAARACAVVEALGRRLEEIEVEIWTTVPEWFFAESLTVPFTLRHLVCDVGLVQKSAIEEDLPATRERLAGFVPFDQDRVSELGEALRRSKCRAVLADIAPLGLAVARAAGIPGVLVENFTWDWIYSGYLDVEPGLAPFIESLRAELGHADLRFRAAPACGEAPGIPVSVIARRRRRSAEEVRRLLGLSAARPLVLVSLGGTPWRWSGLDRWRAQQDLDIVVLGAVENIERRDNLLLLSHRSPIYHPDLVGAADVIVGKLGYSTVAEAVAAGSRFAWLPRPRFPESRVLADFIAPRMPSLELRLEEFESGEWPERLTALLGSACSAGEPAWGAEEVAERLAAVIG